MDKAQVAVKVAICLPWYDGADRDCVSHFLAFQHYLGRLQERLLWANEVWENYGDDYCPAFPKLDPANSTGHSEITNVPRGTQFEFAITDESGCSLVGMARERTIENALHWGADYILMWDDDLIFGTDAFLRLYLDDVPAVAALAFTARKPVEPVIYKFSEWNVGTEKGDFFRSDTVYDYQRDCLQQVDGFGSGLVLIKSEVFRRLEKPWFATQSGLGEDVYFCYRCKKAGIPVYVDTRVKTVHKPTFQETWHDELAYDRFRNGNTAAAAESVLIQSGT